MRNIFNQNVIRLEIEEHKYVLAKYPEIHFKSATTLIGEYFEKFDKYKIANNLIKKYPKYINRTQEELIEEWNKKAEYGSFIHEEIEKYVKTGIHSSDKRAEHGIHFLNKYKMKYEMDILPEAIIYSKELGVAGTIDLITIDKKTKEVEIIDWKTGRIDFTSYQNKMCTHEITRSLMDCNLEKYSMQLSLYRYLLENYYGLNVVKQTIGHITEDTCIAYIMPYKESYIKQIIKNHKKGEV